LKIGWRLASDDAALRDIASLWASLARYRSRIEETITIATPVNQLANDGIIMIARPPVTATELNARMMPGNCLPISPMFLRDKAEKGLYRNSRYAKIVSR
jgi:hypothetical protein